MADILKLKKKAADFEAKKQMDKALDVYREIVQAYEDGHEDAIDIPLYNRVGDMLQKAGSLPEAVSYWEKAVDRYTEGGFFNPAIALCNKILRASPGRMVIYYKLGKIHAEKGFKADARQNFLEYASRQQKAGHLDEAFKALKEFAELVPDQYDVRLMLADQLVKASRRDEAIAQLQLGFAQASADGNNEAAESLAAKMKEIDPTVEPTVAGRAETSGGGGLVFLDLDDGDVPPASRTSSPPTPLGSQRASRAIEGLSLIPLDDPIAEPPSGPARETRELREPVAATDALQIEPTNVGADVPPPPRGALMGLEATDLAGEFAAMEDLPLLELEPATTADSLLPEVDRSATGDIPFVLAEPMFGGDVPLSDPASPAALFERVGAAPEDFALRRQYAEAVLEHGDRERALRELEVAMAGFEEQGDLDTAGSIAGEIVRLQPQSIRHHQKRVEYAFRVNDRVRLSEAYVELAGALLADGQALNARAVYQRVLDLDPADLRAQAAIESIALEEELPPQGQSRRSTTPPPFPAAASSAPAVPGTSAPKADAEVEYVSLGDWLREDEEPKNTRMVVAEQEPSGDEAADFADMLRKFKQGVSENVEEEDYEAHYDLGVAYKEMGLLDEAIFEFQKALRGTAERARTFEALGYCFVEKGQLPVAATILQRALSEPGVRDESLVGVLYLLGAIAEEQKRFADAKKHYERVFAVDIRFRDVGERLNSVEQRLS